MPRIRLHLKSERGLPGERGPADAGDRSYDIIVGPRAIEDLGPSVAGHGGRRAVVIVDAAVAESHGRRAVASLQAANIDVTTILVPSGERSKSVSEANRIWETMAELAVDRRSHVVAVGGGVVGDLAGFTAASFARGLPVWQVPTTLVAQVDSAIGGKTGINLAAGKNLVGAFWQPRGVFCDVETLSTLPEREFRSGMAEVVKYGMILDADFFAWLEQNVAPVLAREASALTSIVERSAALKARVVEQDELERTGLRAMLNYGHTFGHAFETACGYGSLLHGEAVAIGMHCAARLAESLGRIDGGVVDRQQSLLDAFGLPHEVPQTGSSAEELIAIMRRDKKAVGGRLSFVLPNRVGLVELVDGIDPSAVVRVLG